jgi:DNA-damage-inducible protein J
MAATAVVRARIDEKTKRKAAKALKKVGLSVSDAIRLTMVKIAEGQTPPFDLHVPNAETIAAIEELEKGGGRRVSSVEELFAELNADD